MLIVDSCVFIDAFDPESPNHRSSITLLEQLRARDIVISMPAHGWFEVQCTFQKLSAEQRFVGPFIAGRMDYPVRLIHIDDQFIRKYAMADIPYLKAGDHIFVVVAKANSCPLVTSDEKMFAVSKDCGVSVFKPSDFLKQLGES